MMPQEKCCLVAQYFADCMLNLIQTPLQPSSFPCVSTGLIILSVFFFSAVNSSPLKPGEVMMSINKSAFILPHQVWMFPKSFKQTGTDTNAEAHLCQECWLQLTIPILISLAQQIGKISFLETSLLKNTFWSGSFQFQKAFSKTALKTEDMKDFHLYETSVNIPRLCTNVKQQPKNASVRYSMDCAVIEREYRWWVHFSCPEYFPSKTQEEQSSAQPALTADKPQPQADNTWPILLLLKCSKIKFHACWQSYGTGIFCSLSWHFF